MRTLSFFILAVVFPAILLSQSRQDSSIIKHAHKLSPSLLQAAKTTNGQLRLIAGVTNSAAFKNQFSDIVQVAQEYNSQILVISVHSSVIGQLLASPLVTFADLADRSPKEELIVSGFDLSANSITAAHNRFPLLTGENLVVSIKENRFDSTDIDLKGRVTNSGIASPTFSGHATIMATMIAGAGNSFYEGKGVAWKAGVQSADFKNLLPEPDAFYKAQRISVQNHSYGTAIENYYGADAAAYDASVVNNPVLLHVFSSGNSGLSSGTGPYAGITGFANITGSFKMAKNNLVVGATDSLGNVASLSSKGPAYDGRIKPELVAFGQDGSSGAAAIVSGVALLLQQDYATAHHDSLAPAALVKAILVNTADDLGTRGPDHIYGYGRVNAYRALTRPGADFTGSLQQGQTDSFTIQMSYADDFLHVTLAWTDLPAPANAPNALQNDLDLELVSESAFTGPVIYPWIVSHAPNKDSLLRPAIRGRDSVNNVEHVSLSERLDGVLGATYTIKIKGKRVTGSQRYHLVVRPEERDHFDWYYPMPKDAVTGGTTAKLRFNSTINFASKGSFEYSFGDGNWHPIAADVELSKGYCLWNVPDTFSIALVRMVPKDRTVRYETDTFVISKRINTSVGINCPDSFMFNWNRPPGVSTFRVYKVGDKFLEPVATTTDTFYMTATGAVNSKQFTVVPVIKNREGIKSYAFDYTTQGTGCRFRSFLARLDVNRAELKFELGSLYDVGKIIVQKLSGNSFQDIQTINNPTQLQYTTYDQNLQQGANIYRVALQSNNGRIIYSNTEIVYFTGNGNYLIYPNPSAAVTGFKILQRDAEEIRVLLHDAAGRIVKDERHASLINSVSTINLQKGLYVITILKEGEKVFTGKVVLQ
jgi:hypothetical protein